MKTAIPMYEQIIIHKMLILIINYKILVKADSYE